ncbi:MAG: DUF1287 domain-containing protein [Alphaproteobacteria bacterium]
MLRVLTIFVAALALALPAAAQGWAPASEFHGRLANVSKKQTRESVVYDPSYRVIAYPGGDVPRNRGVCTDVLIRAYREFTVDLQVLVHEDMRDNFDKYPQNWGLRTTDTNIDHRRVPNLVTFFKRHGETLRISDKGLDYRPGDLVTWTVAGSLPHIGIVSDELTPDGARPLIVHNIGEGPKLEDMLFDYPITGHYRYPGV